MGIKWKLWKQRRKPFPERTHGQVIYHPRWMHFVRTLTLLKEFLAVTLVTPVPWGIKWKYREQTWKRTHESDRKPFMLTLCFFVFCSLFNITGHAYNLMRKVDSVFNNFSGTDKNFSEFITLHSTMMYRVMHELTLGRCFYLKVLSYNARRCCFFVHMWLCSIWVA